MQVVVAILNLRDNYIVTKTCLVHFDDVGIC